MINSFDTKEKIWNDIRRNEKKGAKKLFNEFNENLKHFFKMDKEIKDLKKDPKNLNDDEYIKKLDEKLICQSHVTQKYFCNLELLLNKCWYEKKTIKSWIKKWMDKYRDDPNYINNMKIFIKNECRDIINHFPENYFL
jgi:hypothetical protein